MLLQLLDNLEKGILPVAVFEDFLTRALDFNGAFGEKNSSFLAASTPAATGGEAWLAHVCWMGHLVSRNPECARRRPARLYVCEVKRVELRPQNVALVAQSLDDSLLFGA